MNDFGFFTVYSDSLKGNNNVAKTLANDVAVASRLNNRRRYVDDTICSIKADSIEYILSILNSFNKNIQFTVEIEKEEKIPFLTH